MTIYDRIFFVSKKNVLMYRYIYSVHAFNKYLPNTFHVLDIILSAGELAGDREGIC